MKFWRQDLKNGEINNQMQKNIYPVTFPSWLFLLNFSTFGVIHILNYVTKMEYMWLGLQKKTEQIGKQKK